MPSQAAIAVKIPAHARKPFPGCKGRAFVYARVSGEHDHRTLSLETQAQRELDPLARDGYIIGPEDIRFERMSGINSTAYREELQQIIRLAEQGYYKAGAFHNPDRLVRGIEVVYFIRRLEEAGCVVYLDGQPSIPSDDRDLMLAIGGYASKKEAGMISERTGRVRQEINARGQWVGGGSVRYGLTFDKETRARTAHPEYAPIVRRAFDLIAAGKSTIEVARTFNAEGIPAPGVVRASRKNPDPKAYRWTASRIGFIIREPTYMGLAYRNRHRYRLDDQGKKTRTTRNKGDLEMVPREEWILCEAARTEALVSADLWARANAALDKVGSWAKIAATRQEKRPYLLRGHAFCGHCGRRLQPLTHLVGVGQGRPGRRYAIYRCKGKSNPFGDHGPCPGNSVHVTKLDGLVRPFVDRLLALPDVVDDLIAAVYQEQGEEAEVLAERDRAAAARRKLARSLEALAADLDDPDLGPEERKAIRQRMKLVGEEGRAMEHLERDCEARLVPLRDRQRLRDAHRDRVRAIRARVADRETLTDEDYRDAIEALGIRFYYAAGGIDVVMQAVLSQSALDTLLDPSSLKGTCKNGRAGRHSVAIDPTTLFAGI
jgi:DNA invertase Pin-like site-specific DNA recombinase